MTSGWFTDSGTCESCGKHVNLDDTPPCPHGFCACDSCEWSAVCADCRRDAFAEMSESGDYDPKSDVLYDHTAPEPVDRIERDGGYEWEGRWIEVPRRAEQRDAELARLLDVDGCFEELNKQAERGRPA